MQSNIDARFAQLSHYLQRHWALVPLHDVGGVVVGGSGLGAPCSCQLGTACRSPGKHPRGEQWQRPENLVRDVAGLAAALARWPSSNWGLATGLISGVWALDYDPKSVDPLEAHLVAAVLQDCWATATWVQRTGSGGLHFVFTLPPDFVPNNGTGRLPKGFDVRGARRGESGGGQIVLAPSVSGVGAYEVVAERPVAAGPAGVIEAVRPAPPRMHSAPMVPLAAQSPGQVASYVLAGVEASLAKLRGAHVGGRNHAAASTARRLLELTNTGVVDREAVYAAWWAAGKAHPDPHVTVPDAELLGVWGRAERDIGDRPADLSRVGGAAGWIGGDAIFPTGAPAATPMLGGGPGAAGGGGAGALQQGVAGDAGSVASQVMGVTSPVASPIDPVEAMLSRMLTPEQMRLQKPPEPLVNGVLDLDSAAWLIGKSGSYKSFVALDLAIHVGRGEDWCGHRVRQGRVVYVVAEGARGMRLRVDAWEREYGPIKDVLFLPEPVQADERRTPGAGSWSVLVEAVRRLQPLLVIIDTQARVTIGLKENDNSDMSYYAEQADRIKRVTGACVLTVHHIGRGGSDSRGASSIDGAQDAELRVERPRDAGKYVLKLYMDKQKDQDEGAPVTLRLRRSEAGMDGDTGRDLSSLVLVHGETPELGGGPSESKVDVGRRRALALYMMIDDHLIPGGEGLLRAEIRKLFFDLPEIHALPTPSQRSAWHRAWTLLVSRGRVIREHGSQRLRVFPPPDGAGDGLLTMNTGGPEDAAPDGWSILGPEADRQQAVDKAVDSD